MRLRERLGRYAPYGVGGLLALSSVAYFSSSPVAPRASSAVEYDVSSSSSSSLSSSSSKAKKLRRASEVSSAAPAADLHYIGGEHAGGGSSSSGRTSAAGKNQPLEGGGTGSDGASDGGSSEDGAPLPHIVLFFVDDLGFNDIGYNSYDIPDASPFLTELAATGLKLTHYYTEYDCTPARAALMTGKYPIKIGMQHECVTPTAEWGLKKSETTIANYLKHGGGYATHIIGKWDLGHYARELWPTNRGFDTFYGLTCYGYMDYFTHDNKGFWDLHDWNAKTGLRRSIGYDRDTGMTIEKIDGQPFLEKYAHSSSSSSSSELAGNAPSDPASASMGDAAALYEASRRASMGSAAAQAERLSRSLSDRGGGSGTTTTVSESDTYSTYLFGQRARDIIDAHPRDTPLFLYIPFNAVHNTVSTPKGWNETTIATTAEGSATFALRKTFAGALYLMDEECRLIVDKMKSRHLYDDAIFIMASDNGGSPTDGGNNWPLRGAKKTMFEGGHRVPAFVHSPRLAKEVRGTSFSGLVHVSDWAPTLVLGAADIEPDVDTANFDGYNLWGAFNELNSDSPRKEVLLNIDYVANTGDEEPVGGISHVWMGIIMEIRGARWKLLIHQSGTSYYYYNSNDPYGSEAQNGNYSNFLYDLSSDEIEAHNLFDHMTYGDKEHNLKLVTEELAKRLCVFYRDVMVPTQYKIKGSTGKAALVENDDFVTYWRPYNDTILAEYELKNAPVCSALELSKKLWMEYNDRSVNDDLVHEGQGGAPFGYLTDDERRDTAPFAPIEESDGSSATDAVKTAVAEESPSVKASTGHQDVSASAFGNSAHAAWEASTPGKSAHQATKTFATLETTRKVTKSAKVKRARAKAMAEALEEKAEIKTAFTSAAADEDGGSSAMASLLRSKRAKLARTMRHEAEMMPGAAAAAAAAAAGEVGAAAAAMAKTQAALKQLASEPPPMKG